MQHFHLQLMSHQRLHRWQDRRGFTTVETLIASAVGLMAAAAFLAFNHFQLHAIENQVTQLGVQNDSRAFVDLFAREVRRSGADPTCAKNVTAITEATASKIHIQADLNSNGVVDNNNNEDVTYNYDSSAGVFQRTANGTTETLLSGLTLTGTSLRYYDSSGNELVPSPSLSAAQRGSVRRVKLQLSASSSAVGSSTAKLTAAASTNVDLRNRYFVASTACS